MAMTNDEFLKLLNMGFFYNGTPSKRFLEAHKENLDMVAMFLDESISLDEDFENNIEQEFDEYEFVIDSNLTIVDKGLLLHKLEDVIKEYEVEKLVIGSIGVDCTDESPLMTYRIVMALL